MQEDVAKDRIKIEESMRIGTMQRTARIWKKNGNLKTIGKILGEVPLERQLRYAEYKVQAGKGS